MLISEAFKAYANDIIVFRNQSKKTEENHYICMRSLIVYFGDIDICDLSFPLVRDWKMTLERSRSPATVRNYVIKLRVVLDYLIQHNFNVLPPSQIPVPKRHDKVPSYLNKDQVTACISATAKTKNKAIVSLLYASGIRINELCSLDKGQIRDKRFTVVGKGGKARLCFVDDRSLILIQMYLESRTDNDPALFLTEAGRRITPGTVQETFKYIRRRTGLEVHPHTLRHSFATNLLQSNTNLFHVSKMLGHAQLSTTQAYLHVVDADLQQIYEKHHTV